MTTNATTLQDHGDDLFDDEYYTAALISFTKDIEADPKNPECYLRRAQTYRKLRDPTKAAADAQKALELTKGKPDQLKVHYRALQLSGTALFETNDYLGSAVTFTKAHGINSEDPLNKDYLEKLKAHVSEQEIADAMVMKPPAPEPAFTPASAAPKIAQGWYQTDTHVVIDIFIKKANKQNVIVKFGDNSVEFTHRLSEDSETNFDFDPLFGQIVPDESSYEVLSTKIEVRLKKKVPGSKWTSLVADKNDDKVEVKDAAHKYPTSSKVQRNWDKIAKDTENDPELKPSGEQAMTQLFQQIYRDGDENTRRAMIKSYQESNGTALSTNWEEVKKNPVETKPPESMLAKKYEY